MIAEFFLFLFFLAGKTQEHLLSECGNPEHTLGSERTIICLEQPVNFTEPFYAWLNGRYVHRLCFVVLPYETYPNCHKRMMYMILCIV